MICCYSFPEKSFKRDVKLEEKYPIHNDPDIYIFFNNELR